MTSTQHYFLPSARQGLSTSLVGLSADRRRAKLGVSLEMSIRAPGGGVSAASLPAPVVQLLGPGDILGFDPRIVVRTSPEADVGNYEPDLFPHIEFADADFPWRFTATNAHSEGSVMPWITLVALAAEGGDAAEYTAIEHGERALPRRIRVNHVGTLPNPQHLRRWAHVHVTGAGSGGPPDKDGLIQTLREQPERAVSRLLCTRRLKPKVKYRAFVVPTFELGRKAGLGLAFADMDDALTPAWDDTGSGSLELPYYYSWEFRTGLRGDFEHLVRQLEPRKLTGLGKRTVSCESPGFGQPPVTRLELPEDDPNRHSLEVEGGLQSLDTQYTPWGRDLELHFPEPGGFDDIKVARVAADAIEIAWRTAMPARPRIEYGLSPEALDRVVPDASDRSYRCIHRLRVAGFTLNQPHYLRIVAEYESAPPVATEIRSVQLQPMDPLQSSLAALLNKPSTEDRQPAEFALTMNACSAISAIQGKALPTGDSVEITIHWQTEVPQRVRIDYSRNAKTQSVESDLDASSSTPALRLNKVVPGNDYTYSIHARHADGAYEEVTTGAFTMPPLPMVLPPVYGRWHRGKLRAQGTLLDAGNQREWLEALNLDPRHRIAAGLGAAVVRDAQEPLMASAWDQLGAVRQVNDTLRASQLARDVSTQLHRRLTAMTPEAFLKVTARAQRRVLRAAGEHQAVTAAHFLHDETPVPKAAVDAGFRRIGGPRHSIFKRQQRSTQEGPLPKTRQVGVALATGGLAGAGRALQLLGSPRLEAVNRRLLSTLGVRQTPQLRSSARAMRVNPLLPFDGSEISTLLDIAFTGDGPFAQIKDDARKAEENARRDPTTTVLDGWLQSREQEPQTAAPEFLDTFTSELATALRPQDTVTERARRQLTRDGNIARRFAPGAIGDPLEPMMWAPEFWQPMYEALRDKSHALLLPGVDKVPNDTLGLLRTNRRFVEAYLAGCNHEFAGELLWRGFPSDQRGSYFRQFWDTDAYVMRANERRQILERWLSSLQMTSVAELPLAEKQRLFGRDLDAAIDLLVAALLQAQGATREEELDANVRRLLITLRNDQLGAIGHDALRDAVNQVSETLAIQHAVREGLADIKPMTQWRDGSLGSNTDRPSERLVLVIRGDLLKRYPGAVIYAIDAVPKECSAGPAVPALKEYLNCNPESISALLATKRPEFPVFRADLPPDLTLLGFAFDQETARGNGADQLGKYLVIEERVSEPRFGLDTPGAEPPEISGPNDLNWSHFGFGQTEQPNDPTYLDKSSAIAPQLSGSNLMAEWASDSSAKRARLTLQQPVRIAIHASQMLPADGD